MAEVTKRDDPQLGDSVTRAKSVPAEEVAVASEENGNLNDEKKDPSAPAQPAEKKSLWAKTGLSLPLILIMAKYDSRRVARMFNMLIAIPGEVFLQQLL